LIALYPLLAGWVTVWSSTAAPDAELIDVRVAGDVMLGRFAGRVIERKGADVIFRDVRSLFVGADLVFANLESPLTRREIVLPGPYRFTANPQLAEGLGLFDGLSVENNHALDAGRPGLVDSVEALERAGIAALTREARVFEIRGRTLRVAAFDFTEGRLPEGAADLVLVHWGVEYGAVVSAQRDLAELLVANGAKLIAGAHPHVMQPVQEIRSSAKQGLVAYSLGNLVFDQPHRGLVMRALFGARGVVRVDLATVELVQTLPRIPKAEVFGFDGKFFSVKALLPPKPARTAKLAVDLRGDGAPLDVTLNRGVVRVEERGALRWMNEDRAWQVKKMEAGDPDRDGRLEVLLLVEKNGGTHPFVMGERRGRFRIIWGGSATARPILDLALGDFDGDAREELAVLDGEGELSIWRWYTWGFEEIARSAVSRYRTVDAIDLDEDGRDELVVRQGLTSRETNPP
jgi:poly-gamma-glutamate synthesis protein (capsule biosynthesis protein)